MNSNEKQNVIRLFETNEPDNISLALAILSQEDDDTLLEVFKEVANFALDEQKQKEWAWPNEFWRDNFCIEVSDNGIYAGEVLYLLPNFKIRPSNFSHPTENINSPDIRQYVLRNINQLFKFFGYER